MILLPINKVITKKLLDHHITSDYIGSALIVLYCLYHKNYTLLDLLDKENEDVLFLSVYKDLEIKGILMKSDDILFELTPLGLNLIQEIEQIVKKSKKIKAVNTYSIDKWIKDWILLWKNERGIFYKSERYGLGMSEKDVTKKFFNFFAEYEEIFEEHSEERIINTIFVVTKNYIKTQKESGFQMARKCGNFVIKVESGSKISDLASLCEEHLAMGNIQIKTEHSLFNTSIN